MDGQFVAIASLVVTTISMSIYALQNRKLITAFTRLVKRRMMTFLLWLCRSVRHFFRRKH
jgi:hypothetical protein